MNYPELEALFYDALALDASQRAGFLDQVGARDTGLRRELESLLQHARSGTLTCLRTSKIVRMEAEIGDTVDNHIDHYAIIREIGRGGMGVVFEARDTKLERPVALKLLHVHQGADARVFLQEARVTARCRHENIVVIHDVGLHHQTPYMVLEFLEGASLRHHLHRPEASDRRLPRPLPAPVMPVERIAALMMPVLHALRCAHEQHVIHCDLKPENIFVTRSDTIKVLDFGIARAMADTVNPSKRVPSFGLSGDSEPGVFAGTPLYMSPEQWGAGAIDARSDIWAVGLILYEMAAGRHPLLSLPPAEIYAHATDLGRPVPSIGEAVAGLGAFAEIIDDCLRKPKAERIQSVAVLIERVESLLSKKPLGEHRGAAIGRYRQSASHAASVDPGSHDDTFVLEFFDLDITRCKQFERSRIAEREYARDLDELTGHEKSLHKKATQGTGKPIERLQERLDNWIQCMPGEPLFKRRERRQKAPLVLLLTIRNNAAEQAILHTIEVDMFERDWLSRGLPGPATRLLEPVAEYEFDVHTPRESFPMIPNIAVAPGDVVSFHVKMDVQFYRYSLRLRVLGSNGGEVETRAIHVW